MNTFRLDASGWRSRDDFYDALLGALGAPEWHGRNLDALWDSVATGDINAVEPPYRVVIGNAAGMPAELAVFVGEVAALFEEARRNHGVAVWLEVG